jgi:NAD(P)-dependent dehydrogenase (short-subunit alcohol dehydrogenase family)
MASASKYLSKLQNKSVLIVGGTSGIGFAVAEACLEYGAKVVIAGRSQSKLDDALGRLVSTYPEAKDSVRGHVVDLKNDIEASVTNLLEFATVGGQEKLDHIVSTAGEGTVGITLENATEANVIDAGKMRIAGTLLLCKIAQGYMNKAHTSSITFTGGVAYYRPMEGHSVTAATAGGMGTMALGLAVDLKPIRVNMMSPGAIRTELLQNMIRSAWGAEGEDIFAKKTLLDRIGGPEDVAEMFLGIMKSDYITGQVIHVEGGYLLK